MVFDYVFYQELIYFSTLLSTYGPRKLIKDSKCCAVTLFAGISQN